MIIRPAIDADHDEIWAVLEPIIRAGETYALDRDMRQADGLAYWCSPDREVFVAEEEGRILATYFLRANQAGGGAHVANAGYAVHQEATRRGIARQLCAHSLETARARGFKAMQFNFVVSTNASALYLWRSMGFAIAGTIPDGFAHPELGFVDVHVMYRAL